MFFLFNFFFSVAALSFDSGYYTDLDWKNNFDCAGGNQYNKQINFNGIFYNIPQVILMYARLDMEMADSTNQMQVILNISDITNDHFTLFLQCNQRKLWSTKFRWYAFDDQRIQVLSKYSISNIQQTTTYNHKNPNAVAGFISIVSLGYKGQVAFNISITKITSTNVTVQVSDPQSYLANLISVGYQIILAPQEFFTILNTIWSGDVWSSPSISMASSTFLMLPFIGYEYNNNHIWRLDMTQMSANPYSYSITIWGGSDGFYTPNTHQQISFQQTINLSYLPLFCNHFEAIQKVDPYPTGFTSLNMFILETNQYFTSIGSYSTALENTTSAVNFEITVKCLATQKIQSSFYKFIGQTRKIEYTGHLHECSSKYRILTYYSRFVQQMVAGEELQIDITSNSLNITQIIYNQDFLNQSLVTIQVI